MSNLSLANCYYFAYPYYVSGINSNWQKYPTAQNRIDIDVEICDLGLKKTLNLRLLWPALQPAGQLQEPIAYKIWPTKVSECTSNTTLTLKNLIVEAAKRDNYALNYIIFPQKWLSINLCFLFESIIFEFYFRVSCHFSIY